MYKVINDSSAQASVKTEKLENVYKNLLNNKVIGFTQIPSRHHLFEQSEKLSQELLSKYDQFLIIGIGGSSMGSRALAELSFTQNIQFLDNVDSFEFERIWKTLGGSGNSAASKAKLTKTGFVIVSKSGSTIEILWNYSLLEKLMQENGLKLIDQSYFITELVENPLAQLARKNSRPLLEVPLDVGGRFSVLTPVGLVIAGLCGFSLKDLQAGAKAAVEDSSSVMSACALYLESFKRKEVITLFWFYNSNYRWFGAWLQQLWAESLGKKQDVDGKPAVGFSTPITAIGACDQHSILQQVAHGTDKIRQVSFYSFNSAEKSQFTVKNNSFAGLDFINGRNYGDLISCQAKATEEALKQNGVSTHFFNINDENKSYTTGYLFMYFQLVVAVLGLHENINPFDQPGVTLGKDLTLKKLQS